MSLMRPASGGIRSRLDDIFLMGQGRSHLLLRQLLPTALFHVQITYFPFAFTSLNDYNITVLLRL